ncbi:DUF2523 family protein [Erythrobacter ani]|uniref:DUF2523 domain-containing protein n=1 Tax=Erythrobacter ani TaxID=2827235 RepID=A0ABS6SST5_9SPHN|nr:DUF2523 family protein [Erythrobacter ani]MBV7267562.1 DUF2523 domain-containing protein [Erythrobacter ani]
MFAILRAAFTWLISYVLGKALFVTIFAGLLAIIWTYALDFVGGAVDLQGAGDGISSLPADMLFFLLVLRIDIGMPILLGAWIVRFSIRRLPVIG